MRTDEDTWDITTSVGATALFVAAARALEAQRAVPLAVDPYAEVFCRAVGGESAELVDGKAPDHILRSEWGEVFQSFQGARTRYFDNFLCRAAAEGVHQVVIVAAGLDSRAYRLPWPEGTIVFELDQPKVLEFKREVLAEHGDLPKAERREVAVDLREDWPTALRDNGFEAARPSAWVAEGLLPYLPAAAREQLFCGITGLAAQGSHVAVEEMTTLDEADIEAKRADERASGRNRFFTLVYNEEYRDAVQWFGEPGWDVEVTLLTEYLQALGRPLPPPESDGGQMLASGRLVSATRPGS